MPKLKVSVAEFFISKIRKTSTCWIWTGFVGPNGYGSIGKRYVHRLSYEMFVGTIPEKLEIDHLCRNRRCVNPSHLEPVTHKENSVRGFGTSGINARKSSCLRGHEFNRRNTRIDKNGSRKCRICHRMRQAARRAA